MTEEQIFKNLFPEYCAGERCLSPYFDLFQIGFEEGESRLKAIYKKQRNKRIDELQKQCKKLEYAKTIIEELLSSCFGYNSKTVNYEVKAKAEAFLEGE